jgi:hypothetical protein
MPIYSNGWYTIDPEKVTNHNIKDCIPPDHRVYVSSVYNHTCIADFGDANYWHVEHDWLSIEGSIHTRDGKEE